MICTDCIRFQGLDWIIQLPLLPLLRLGSHLGWISGLLIENIDLVTRNWDQQKAENSLRSFPEPRPNFDVQFDFKI